ncbi:protoheme IX farnesyltransferase [Paraliobacillus quinghaiensis]|uniref:Protoheme IX farnesyltransferase n=1 Tax=Paraliobacillus quinghaiensis TaxID=470815 RepID=A0A917TEE3_9BACI|nr:heme o synthase [Paraliobacillus quinghaiensis]GGM20393.1 protoheme IX farnesyltransferase [Paraliobacillus quinghaiensis]
MSKMEVTSTEVFQKIDVQDRQSISSDLKALFKTGIIQSNVMTAFAGFWVALFYNNLQVQNHWLLLLVTLAGTAGIIAGGCILNNYYDRDIDPVMSRTKQRPTVTGSIPLPVILGLGVALSILGVILLLFTTWQAALLGILGWFAYVVLYTMWSKRRYTLNTAIGSLSGAVPPLIGWAAIEPELSLPALALFALMFVWQTPHFLALAMKKTEEYRAANVPMLPVVHGFAVTKRQIVMYIICLFPLPLFLSSLGVGFMLLASGLNVGWLGLALKDFNKKDDLRWANQLFVYSLLYLTVIFVSMVIFTLPAVI